MTFYGIHYLESQGNLSNLVKYGIIFAVLIFFLIVFIRYLKSRINTKYRDLSLILFLCLFFVAGTQYNQYVQTETQTANTSQMVSFIKSVAEQLGKEEDSVYVNSTNLQDQLVLAIDDNYYVVELSTDRNSFRIEPTYLTNTEVTKID
ncbi:DUF3290 domain-containing protein [Enterococcus sp. HY326]|uniref:DUF3290 domain-containing protein n=1 Tax=Enterococcus sp. HY326 TaxID=2971265 RepID=UPI00223F4529|nr:DUF3290 domain-containing protein [Enterococcus sp. HY326]